MCQEALVGHLGLLGQKASRKHKPSTSCVWVLLSFQTIRQPFSGFARFECLRDITGGETLNSPTLSSTKP